MVATGTATQGAGKPQLLPATPNSGQRNSARMWKEMRATSATFERPDGEWVSSGSVPSVESHRPISLNTLSSSSPVGIRARWSLSYKVFAAKGHLWGGPVNTAHAGSFLQFPPVFPPIFKEFTLWHCLREAGGGGSNLSYCPQHEARVTTIVNPSDIEGDVFASPGFRQPNGGCLQFTGAPLPRPTTSSLRICLRAA